ncbi:MAG: hypothetical protein WB626_01820 [Bacteroidota bacterium]
MKHAAWLLPLIIVLWVPAPLRAELPENTPALVEHLEYLGYEVTTDTTRVIAKHTRYLNLVIRKFRGGLLVTSWYKGNAYAADNRDDFKSFVNDLNVEAVAVRFYVDRVSDMMIEGYFPGVYDKTHFAAFLDAYNSAQAQLTKNIEDLRRFVD